MPKIRFGTDNQVFLGLERQASTHYTARSLLDIDVIEKDKAAVFVPLVFKEYYETMAKNLPLENIVNIFVRIVIDKENLGPDAMSSKILMQASLAMSLGELNCRESDSGYRVRPLDFVYWLSELYEWKEDRWVGALVSCFLIGKSREISKSASINEISPPTQDLDSTDTNGGMMSSVQHARNYRVPDSKLPAFDQALRHWRKNNLLGTDYIEHDARAPNRPKYFYKESAVKHIVLRYGPDS